MRLLETEVRKEEETEESNTEAIQYEHKLALYLQELVTMKAEINSINNHRNTQLGESGTGKGSSGVEDKLRKLYFVNAELEENAFRKDQQTQGLEESLKKCQNHTNQLLQSAEEEKEHLRASLS